MLAPENVTAETATNKIEASTAGVSWAAVTGGAFVAAALSLILLALGAGAGLSSLSPWSNAGVSPSAVGVGALLWLTLVEILSCSLGGYLAGRLRTKWVNVHSHEVYFRDTAHGFLVWAVALVMTAAFLTSAAAAMVGAENRAPNGAGSESRSVDANQYFIDSLFRSSEPSNVNDDTLRAETSLIFAHALRERGLPSDDREYLTSKVSARTGLSRPEAGKRVTEVFESDQQAINVARKAIAHALYWLFVALLLGAFSASLAATFGGKQRDHIYV